MEVTLGAFLTAGGLYQPTWLDRTLTWPQNNRDRFHPPARSMVSNLSALSEASREAKRTDHSSIRPRVCRSQPLKPVYHHRQDVLRRTVLSHRPVAPRGGGWAWRRTHATASHPKATLHVQPLIPLQAWTETGRLLPVFRAQAVMMSSCGCRQAHKSTTLSRCWHHTRLGPAAARG